MTNWNRPHMTAETLARLAREEAIAKLEPGECLEDGTTNPAHHAANLARLNLSGSAEPFYLNDGESVQWIRFNGNGTATVRVQFADGGSDVIDADIR
jgi:hypothetical protein